MKKICPVCRREKLAEEFYPNSARTDGVSCYCKECTRDKHSRWREANREHVRVGSLRSYHENKIRSRETRARWRARNPDKIRNSRLIRKFGITLKDYYCLLEAQNGVCAICGRKDYRKGGVEVFLAVDHDHVSGKIRGLLCLRCNLDLALIENTTRVKELWWYLEITRQKEDLSA